MSQSEEIQKLYSTEIEYKIPKKPQKDEQQATITITALCLDDLGLADMKKDLPMAEMKPKMIKLIAKSLNTEEEQAAKISFRHMEDIMDSIMDANNFSAEDNTKMNKFKSFLKDKSEAHQAKKLNEPTVG